jgi:hypothetical protein
MALVIEMPDEPSPPEEAKEVMRVFELELSRHNVCTYFVEQQAGQTVLCFAVTVCAIHENIYRIRVQEGSADVVFGTVLAPRGGAGGTLPNELLKQAIRSVRNINSMASKFPGLLAVNPSTGQLKIMVQTSTSLLESLAVKQAYFSTTLDESVRLMNNFAPMHLHNINRLPSHAL